MEEERAKKAADKKKAQRKIKQAKQKVIHVFHLIVSGLAIMYHQEEFPVMEILVVIPQIHDNTFIYR